MILWASKFAAAKIECSLDMREVNTFGGTIYFASDGTHYIFSIPHVIQLQMVTILKELN